MSVIKMENVTMKYPTGTVALKDINIEIEKGEFVFVVGSTGSGKTTFLELLLRELVPTKGRIEVAGIDLARLKKNRIHKVRRKIGVVFQNFRLLKDRTVYENVAFAQRVIETPSRYIKRQVPAVLALVGLEDKYKSYPRQLSGGEQQRVALARALVNKPEIILADGIISFLLDQPSDQRETDLRLNECLVFVHGDSDSSFFVHFVSSLICDMMEVDTFA